eukprot:TRINITY_DN29154_c0_g1_i2.p1 TRINITY_DN29154_c0_g1~~TRINITY_DN29154_c0_g1_i2.p1  ORF type:complete len:261 (-),score=24.52 TRINITY_DN29154_c0_g1_i2:152-934(-)
MYDDCMAQTSNIQHPLSNHGDQVRPASPAQRLSKLQQGGLLLPSTSEVLCWLPGDKLKPAAVTSLREGDRLYCASLGTDSPVMVPVTIQKIAFQEVAAMHEMRMRGHMGRESVALVDSSALLIRTGPRRLKWMPWWAVQTEQQTVMSVDVATVAFGFSAADLVVESVTPQKETPAIQLWLAAACAPCVRMCDDGGKAGSKVFAPVAPWFTLEDMDLLMGDDRSQSDCSAMSASNASSGMPPSSTAGSKTGPVGRHLTLAI